MKKRPDPPEPGGDHQAQQGNEARIEFAKRAIEEMAREAIRKGLCGTIAVELSLKDGKLGRVKRQKIDFQPE